MGVDCKGAEFVGNKQTDLLTHSPTDKHTNTQLYILVPTGTWNSLPADHRDTILPLLLQASSQGLPVSAVVYAAAGRWAQHRSSGAVVTVQRVRSRLQIFRLTYLLN